MIVFIVTGESDSAKLCTDEEMMCAFTRHVRQMSVHAQISDLMWKTTFNFDLSDLLSLMTLLTCFLQSSPLKQCDVMNPNLSLRSCLYTNHLFSYYYYVHN